MIELEHSPLGGSGAHRFINCAGSFLLHREQLEDGTFENVSSEFAELGTGAHELGAICLATGDEPFEYLGEKFNGYLAGWPDGISLDAVQVYVNACRAVIDRLTDRREILVERTFKLPHIHPLFKGTVDFGHWSISDGVDLIDYKNGEGIGVSAVNNQQLLYYGFLLIMSDEDLRTANRNLPVRLGIVQPNFYGLYEDPDIWHTTLGFVMDWGLQTLLPRMNDLMAAGLPTEESDFVTGEHCQFCPVMLDCPKMQRAFQEYADAEEDFVTMLTNEELDHLYSQRENARRFMKTLEATVKARKLTGANIPSAKLVEPKTSRVWRPGAEGALKAAFGNGAYKPAEIKSPAQIEKVSSRGKEMALEWGYKPEAAGLTVAPLSDPRPEAKPRTNATVFAAHVQSPEDQGF